MLSDSYTVAYLESRLYRQFVELPAKALTSECGTLTLRIPVALSLLLSIFLYSNTYRLFWLQPYFIYGWRETHHGHGGKTKCFVYLCFE